MISGACTRHAYKPLFENLPACTREGGKFRVFPRLFDLNHRKFAGFASNCALSGRIPRRQRGRARNPLSPSARPTATLSHFLRENYRCSLTSCGKVTDALSLLVGYEGGVLAWVPRPTLEGVRERCPRRCRNRGSVRRLGAGSERGLPEKGAGTEGASGVSVQVVREGSLNSCGR
jgi:hypothetical protein